MKLILCFKCEDVVRLFGESRACRCGSSGGRYIDSLNAEVWGTCVPLGFDSSSLAVATNEQPKGPGPGKRFNAFVIPKTCSAVKVVEKPKIRRLAREEI